MRLLFDTHFLIGFANDALTPHQRKIIDACSDAELHLASVASLWEIAIKFRIGKLKLDADLAKLPDMLEAYGFSLLAINETHALETLHEPAETKDPFDGILLAQCQVERLQLVTIDRTLSKHPLAWRAP
ncbi:MAG TPA: type II toxin-antitoxin system VapC family toxin [Rhizomicrobium sp.]|jgi:PIN domain nuclease of toxin-antitoxin system|nr:type II toxin-antitoxin system VapC family toxin [Rhizomicrobium sp.]